MNFQFLKELKLIHIVLFIISIIPFGIYPFLLLANVMSLAGHKSGNESFLEMLLPYSFLIFSTLYPLTFFYSWINWRKKKISISLLPIFHIIISLILFFLWLTFGN
jgi:hypothetical protein